MKNRMLSQTSIHIVLMICICMVVIIMFHSNSQLSDAMKQERMAMDRKEISSTLSSELKAVSDYLTEQSRKYVLTKETTYHTNYWSEVNKTKRREKIIKDLRAMHLLDEEEWLLEAAKRSSDELILIEKQAMEIQSLDLLFDKSYSYKKEIIDNYIRQFQDMINLRMEREVKKARLATQREMWMQRLSELIAGALFIISFIIVYVFTIKPTLNYAKQLEENNEEQLNPHGTREIYRLGTDIYKMYQNMSSAIHTKSEYVAVMSHEIRIPLHSMLGYTYLLNNTVLDKQQKEYTTYLDRSIKSLLELVTTILDYEKMGKEKIKIEKVKFTLKQLKQEIEDSFKLKCEEKNIDLLIEIEEINGLELSTDYVKIKRLCNNLIGNAIKFTTKGFVKVTLRQSREGNRCQLLIKVQDTGIGIDEAHYDKIFMPYEQAEKNITQHFGGTGLGLSICKQIVELLEGKITVKSKIGEGACFTVYLPVEEIQIRKEEEWMQLPEEEVSKAQWQEIQRTFMEYIETGDFQATKYFETHKPAFKQYLGNETMKILAQYIDQFQFEHIKEMWQDDTI